MKAFKIGDKVRVVNRGLNENQIKYIGKKGIVEQIHDDDNDHDRSLSVRFKNGSDIIMYAYKFKHCKPKKEKIQELKPLDNYEKLHQAFFELLYTHACQYEINGIEEGSQYYHVINNWKTKAGVNV